MNDAASYTAVLSEYTASIRFGDLPDEVVEQAKQLTLHVLGVSLASLPLDQANKVTDLVQAKGGAAESTVWGSDGRKVPADEAALANATLSDLLDWEDCSWTGHPSAGAIPAAFAIGEKLSASGADYITSVVVAYEVYQRIAMAVQPTRDRWGSGKGWGLVSWQVHSAVIAAAKLMDLDAHRVAQALGAAYFQTIITASKHVGGDGVGASDIYHYAHGFCARNGISAAMMAEIGFDAMTDSLDGPNGLWAQVSDQVDWSWHDRELGTRYLILETLYKGWPANMWVQGPLDCLDALASEYDLSAENIKRIDVSPTIPMIMENSTGAYDGILDAQFHLPYCFAVYLRERDPGSGWFSPQNRADPEVRAIADRVTSSGEIITPFEAFEIFWTGSFPEVTVAVDLTDGTTVSHTLRYPKGHPRNAFTWAETEALFRRTASTALPADQIDQIIDVMRNLEDAADLHHLAALMVRGGEVS
ncbi:MAG: MmgE/PrpD family protein [Actinomycetia bacterium]|nr:MmgE/PrpD family protein [Actinomycetes bacterium]MCP4222364.1 MmgE/PrpD family protein [Actinomycetes bacterium]MCP5035202.1 MmgE/PrpD family protein [Actinomycetes bacterium]